MRNKGTFTPVPKVEQLEEAEAFFKHWQIYQKVEEKNYFCHREVCALLHEFLQTHVPRGFVFLDLGCGDAGSILKALSGTSIRRYLGVDLAKPALALAAKNLSRLSRDHCLAEQDFYEFVRDTNPGADVIWMGLAFHHMPLAQKQTFLHLARQILPKRGFLLMYEPSLLENETREQFLDRSWQFLSTACQDLSRKEVKKSRPMWLSAISLKNFRF